MWMPSAVGSSRTTASGTHPVAAGWVPTIMPLGGRPCPQSDETHRGCPRRAPGASRGTARENRGAVAGMGSGLPGAGQGRDHRAGAPGRCAKASKKDKGRMPARGLLGHGLEPEQRAPAPATHDETPTTAVTDLIAPGAPRTPPAGGHDVASEGGHDVASDTGADTTTPTRTQPNTLKQAQNTPKTLKTKQKPASRVHHDAGLSTGSMVGLAGFEPTTP